MAVTGRDTTSLTLSATGNAAGDNVLIGYTTVPKMNDWNQMIYGGTFGLPEGDMAVGDSINGGGYVAYYGPAADGIELKGLKPNTVYHLTAWSRAADGRYSSDTVSVSTTSAAVVPWTPSLSNMAQYDNLVGWDRLGDWKKEDNTTIENQMRTADTQNGTETWVCLPPMYLAEGTNRLVMSILMTEFANHAYYPYSLREGDKIEVQVSANGTDYATVMSYDVSNPLKFTSTESYLKLFVPFTECADSKATVRLYFKLYGAATISVKGMRMEQVGECDYPINLAAPQDMIVGDAATITWTPQGEEDAWEVRYKKSAEAEWDEPIIVREPQCRLTGLAGLTSYDVQARARCSAFSQSQWSEKFTFISGLALPFAINFAELEELPGPWQFTSGVLASPTVMEESSYGWQFMSSFRGSNMVIYGMDGAVDEWLVTPTTNFGDGNVNYIVTLGIQNVQDNDPASDFSISLVVSDADGNFSQDGVVKTFARDELPELYATGEFTAMLKGVKGNARLGLYAHNTTGRSPMIMLNTMSVAYSCPNDAEVTVDAVGDNSISATVSGSAEEWLVFVRKAGDASREYRKVTDGKIEADGLDTRTDYEIGVTKVCEPGDTALVKIVTVTTTGGNCGMPQDVAVVPGKFDATATWTGEASAYNVRYRVYGTERWAEEQVTANTITVGGLTSSTRYELAVQSVCSRAEGDTSAYTTPVEFTTLVETCLPPENVAVVPASESATVTWTGEADKYQVGCTLAGGTETLAIVEGSEFAITGLQPDADYAVRVRAICAEGDTSRWSSTVAFSTEPLAECVTPANLAVSDITDNSATLSWTADGGNTGWNLRWRASSVTSWTNVEGIAATSYQLTGLQPNTLYIWSVQAVCDAGRTSGWSVQNRFTTLLADGIGDIGIDDIRIFVKGKTLNVVNPSGGVIKSVSVYDAAGRTIASFAAGTDENVFIPLSVEGTVIVKVCGEKQAKTVQVVVK